MEIQRGDNLEMKVDVWRLWNMDYRQERNGTICDLIEPQIQEIDPKMTVN
jgi:hypothetical protein